VTLILVWILLSKVNEKTPTFSAGVSDNEVLKQLFAIENSPKATS